MNLLALIFLCNSITFCCHHVSKVDNLSLIVEVHGFRSLDGQLIVTLYNTKEGFPTSESAVYIKEIVDHLERPVIQVKFYDLQTGEYALVAVHDENSDGDMNYNVIGIPKEGYCFSNNVRPFMRAPSWEDARILYRGETILVRIEMKY